MKVQEKGDELVITEFNELEAYKIASKVENDGIEFYKKILLNIKDDKTKEGFTFLLKEEEKHLKLFQGYLFQLRKNIEDGFEEDDILNYLDYDIFYPYQEIKELANVFTDIKKALRLGIIIEEKSVRFYGACREHIQNKAVKGELDNIIGEEKRHKQLIQEILNNIIRQNR